MMYSKLSTNTQDTPNSTTENGPKEDCKEYQPGVRSGQDTNAQAGVYTTYEDLPDFYKGSTDFPTIFKGLQEQAEKDLDWRIQFDIIENLRIFNKFHPRELEAHLDLFPLFISRCIDNLRTNLSKNTLLFVKELFGNFKEIRPSEEFLDIILPKVVEKGVSEKSFIKQEARGALKEIENSGCNNPIIRILGEKSFDKNANVSELSFQTLAGATREAKEDLGNRVSQEMMEVLFQTIAGAIDGKRAANKKVAEDLCQQLKGRFPENQEELQTYLKDKLKIKEQGAKSIARAMQTKKEKAAKPNLSDFIKEKKMQKEQKEDKNKTDGSNSHEQIE